jgi:hypothetical protein
LACKLTGRDSKDFPIKAGADPTVQTGKRARIDWYTKVENSDADRNSPRAKEEGLVRHYFGIYQIRSEDNVMLRVHEWTAEKHWDQPIEPLWSKPYSEMKARKEMAELMVTSIRAILP